MVRPRGDSPTVSNELPDLDENVSFVVDSGAPVGPIAMRTIINSIRSGERAPDALVWWAGATDWVPFSSDSGLLRLLSDLPATEQPPPPTDVDEELSTVVDGPETQGANLEPQAEDDSPAYLATTVIDMGMVEEAQALVDQAASEASADELPADDGADGDGLEERFPEPEVVTFGLADDESAEDAVDDEFADAVAEADAEADALLAREPRDMHPSAAWGVEAEASFEDAPRSEGAHDAVDGVAEADEFEEAEVEDEALVDEPEETVEEVEVDESNVVEQSGLTGLFASPVREDVEEHNELDAADDEASSSRAALETVGARIDALSSATRRSQPFGETEVTNLGDHFGVDDEFESSDHGDGHDPDDADDVSGQDEATEIDEHDEHDGVAGVASEAETEASDELSSDGFGTDDAADVDDAPELDEDESSEEPTSGAWEAVEVDPALDERFAAMVQVSVAHQRRLDWALRVDELLMGACVSSIVDRGYVLLDLDGLEVGQRAVFDRNDDSRHARLSLEPLSPVNAAGDATERHVKVTMSWGRDVADADAAFATLRAEANDDETPPGAFTSDVNMVSSSATTSVDLIWVADDFVTEDHTVDRSEIDASITAILHALERQWYELFTSAD